MPNMLKYILHVSLGCRLIVYCTRYLMGIKSYPLYFSGKLLHIIIASYQVYIKYTLHKSSYLLKLLRYSIESILNIILLAPSIQYLNTYIHNLINIKWHFVEQY